MNPGRPPHPRAPADPPQPGLRVRLAPRTLVRDGGCLLIGGSPTRLIRLGHAAAPLIATWQQGGAVGAGQAARTLARRLLDVGMLLPDPTAEPSGLAVVIPVRDRPRQLARCLQAVRRGTPHAEVCVVDDGSVDPEATEQVAAAHSARVVRHPTSRGPSAARNTGVAHTSGSVVAFVDSDVVVEPGCLPRLAGHFADPATGAAAPRILARERPTGLVAAYEACRSSLDMGSRPGRVRPSAEVPYVPSATLVMRRTALGDGFDEHLLTGEDVDFVWRLAEAGWGVWYDPTVTARHEHRTTLRAFAGRRFAYASSIGPLARRHPTALPALRANAATVVVILALMRRPAAAAGLTGVIVARNYAALRRRAAQPGPLACMLTGRSLIGGGRSLCHAIRRPWWPLVALAGLRHRPSARLLAGAWVAGVLETRAVRPHAVLSVADDVISGAGTWWSCLRSRTARPLLVTTARRPRHLGASAASRRR